MANSAELRLRELGIELPPPPPPGGSYTPCKRTGNLVFVSGQGPVIAGVQRFRGKVGAEVTFEEGREAARLCALNLLSQLKKFLGSLDKVTGIVHLKGFVACSPDFPDQPAVINAASDLMVQVFGEAGRHTRCALGTNALPGDIPVEVELVAEAAP